MDSDPYKEPPYLLNQAERAARYQAEHFNRLWAGALPYCALPLAIALEQYWKNKVNRIKAHQGAMRRRWNGFNWVGLGLLVLGSLLFLYGNALDGLYAIGAGVLLWAVGR